MFCVTTDLYTSSAVIHRNGAMWKYVRASMSLTGYLVARSLSPPLWERAPVRALGGHAPEVSTRGSHRNAPKQDSSFKIQLGSVAILPERVCARV